MLSSTSRLVNDAKDLLAARMRELRERAGLSVEDLVTAAGWHHSRVARIETAERTPSERDIRTWCALTGAEMLAPSLIAAARNLDRLLAAGPRTDGTPQPRYSLHDGFARLYADTTHLRVYQPRFIPIMLQSEAYARAHLTKLLTWRGSLAHLETAISERLTLQRFVTTAGKHSTFVLDELALYTRVCARSRMVEQLSWLEQVADRPNVSLGVLPSDAELPIWPGESFCMYDGTQVRTEALMGSQRRVTAPGEVAEYERAFLALSEEAAYGPAARDLIAAAAGYWDLSMTEQA